MDKEKKIAHEIKINNKPKHPFPLTFEECVKNYLNKPALIYKKEGIEHKIEYQQLNHQVNRLSDYLLRNQFASQKDGRGKLVAIFVSEMHHFIECLLAVWKTGAAYVPISLKEKPHVIEETLKSSQPDFYLSFEQTEFDLISPEKLIITKDLKLDDYSIENPVLQPEICPDDLAYVMYTSGSTGKPKGAAILHRGIPYCLQAHQEKLNLSNADRIAQMARVGFDASLMEILMALGTGAALCVVPPYIREDNEKLKSFFKEHNVTQAIFVPSKLKTFIPKEAESLEDKVKIIARDFASLKGVIVTGEAFTKDLIKPWHEAKKIVINGYGLTETTICTTLGVYEKGKELNIGQPIEGTQIHLVPNDDIKEEEVFEFYVSGASVAKEYWRDSERTQERFIEIDVKIKNKKLNITENTKVRAYQTGDKGKLVEGEVDGKKYSYYLYYGRIDNQLKLRGQRLEPEHIEAKLKAFEIHGNKIIQEAYVVGAQKGDDLHLVAYLIKNSAYIEEVTFETIREYLKACLPGFMVPNAMDWLENTKLFLSVNDKMDRKKLSDYSERPIPFIHTKDTELPKTEEEIKLASVWAKLFGYEKEVIKRKDDFFCLGGSSVKVSELLSRLRKIFGDQAKKLQDEHIYECSSLKEMARLILPSCLYQINKSESDNHIYFVHSLLGDGPTDYNLIAKGLPDYKAFAFRARALDHKKFAEGALDNLQELAADYVSQLLFKHKKSRKPNQPIVLIGWSSGGLIALEMAKQLKQKYEKEPWLVLLDTDYPRKKTTADVVDLGKILAKQALNKILSNEDFENSVTSKYKFEEYLEAVFVKLKQFFYVTNEIKTNQLDFAKWLFSVEHEYAKIWNEVNLNKEKIKVILAEKSLNNNQNIWSNFTKTVIKGTNHFDLIDNSKNKDELSKYLQEIQYEEEFKKLIPKLKQKHLKPITRKRILSEEEWVVTAENYLPVQLVEEVVNKNKDADKQQAHSVDYNDLFSKAGITLIQGAGGSGKTLLTEILAQQAAKNKLWTDKGFDLVLRLPLRRLPNHIKENIELAQIVYYEYFGEIVDKDLLKILEKFVIKRQATIAWILDGFDELISYYNSPSYNNIKHILNILLKNKYVLVTARFEYIKNLNPNNIFTNQGVSDNSIYTYITRSIPNNENAIKLKEIINNNHNLRGLLSNPINLELICYLWINDGYSVNSNITLTELYHKTCDILLIHNLQKHENLNSFIFEIIKNAIEDCLSLLAFKIRKTKNRGFLPGLLLKEAYEEINQKYDREITLEINRLKQTKPYLVNMLEKSKPSYYNWIHYILTSGFLNEVTSSNAIKNIPSSMLVDLENNYDKEKERRFHKISESLYGYRLSREKNKWFSSQAKKHEDKINANVEKIKEIKTLTHNTLRRANFISSLSKKSIENKNDKANKQSTIIQNNVYEFIHLSIEDYWLARFIKANMDGSRNNTNFTEEINSLLQKSTSSINNLVLALTFTTGLLKDKPLVVDKILSLALNQDKIKLNSYQDSIIKLLLIAPCLEEAGSDYIEKNSGLMRRLIDVLNKECLNVDSSISIKAIAFYRDINMLFSRLENYSLIRKEIKNSKILISFIAKVCSFLLKASRIDGFKIESQNIQVNYEKDNIMHMYAEEYCLIGNRDHILKNYHGAVAAYENAIELNPNNADYYHRLGKTYLKMHGFSSEAEEAYKKAISLNSNVSIYHNNLGRAIYNMGGYESAITCHFRAIKREVSNLLGLQKIFQPAGSSFLSETLQNKYDKHKLTKTDVDQSASKTAHDELFFFTHSKKQLAKYYYSLGMALHKLNENGPYWSREKIDKNSLSYKLANYQILDVFIRAINLDPNEVRYHQALGKIYTILGHQDRSQEATEKAIILEFKCRHDDRYADIFFNMGNHCYVQKNYTTAVIYYEKATNYNPTKETYYYNLGNAWYKLGVYTRAAEAYEKSIQLISKDADINIDVFSSVQSLEKIGADEYENMIKFVDRYPNIESYFTKLADAYFLLNEYEKASLIYNKGIAYNLCVLRCFVDHVLMFSIEPRLSECICYDINESIYIPEDVLEDLRTNKSPEEYNFEGKNSFNSKDYQKAAWCFQQAIKINSDDSIYHSNLGHTYYLQEKYEAAIECYFKALALHGLSLDMCNNILGDKFLSDKIYDRAIKCYLQAVRYDPTNALYNANLGYAYYQIEKYENSIVYYSIAVKLKSSEEHYYYFLGNSYYYLNNFKKAAECYTYSISLEPNDVNNYIACGRAHYLSKDYVKAIKHYEKAISLNSHPLDFYDELGDAYFNMKKYKEAVKAYKNAILLNQNNDNDVLFNILGNIYINLMKYEKAILCYDEAIMLMPNSAEYCLNKAKANLKLNNYIKVAEGLRYSIILGYDSCYPHYRLGYLLENNKIKLLPGEHFNKYYHKVLLHIFSCIESDKDVNINTGAYYRLGVIYQFGRGIIKNLQKAIQLYNQAVCTINESDLAKKYKEKAKKRLAEAEIDTYIPEIESNSSITQVAQLTSTFFVPVNNPSSKEQHEIEQIKDNNLNQKKL